MAHEDSMEIASLYSLGLLTPDEALEFDAAVAGDPSRLEALHGANGLCAELASSIEPVQPPAGLRERLMQRIARPPRPPLGAIRSTEGKWKKTEFPGITYKALYFDKVSGLLTTLVRMEPGSNYPAHKHGRTEQCLVIEGDLRHHGHVYGPGDFTYAEAGTLDPALETEGGNLLLIIGAPDTEFVRD
jgi:hypothetical protein